MTEDTDKSKRYRQFIATLEAVQCDLHAYVRYLLGNSSDADDVVQEVNMTLCQEWEAYDSTRPFIAWAKTLAYYQVMTHLKTVSREKVIFDETALDFLAVMDQRDEADGELVARQAYWLKQGLKNLPQQQRSLINFRYRHNYSLAQLSRRYQVSVASLSLLLIRVRRQLGIFITQKMREEDCRGV